jgi:hypothetical protein
MGWMQFVSNLVSSLAWPAAVVAAIAIFRRPISNLIPRLRKISVGSVDFEIDQLAADVADVAEPGGEVAPRAEAQTTAPTWVEGALTLADSSPSGAILVAFSAVEQQVRELARPYGPIQGFNGAVRKLAEGHVISDDVLPLLFELSSIRNTVAHSGPSDVVGTDAAKAYVDTASRIVGLISK